MLGLASRASRRWCSTRWRQTRRSSLRAQAKSSRMVCCLLSMLNVHLPTECFHLFTTGPPSCSFLYRLPTINAFISLPSTYVHQHPGSLLFHADVANSSFVQFQVCTCIYAYLHAYRTRGRCGTSPAKSTILMVGTMPLPSFPHAALSSTSSTRRYGMVWYGMVWYGMEW